jgi:phosphopentomutase
MKALVLVIDSFGIGALPDAGLYGDEGANTALHICEALPHPKWPALRKLGLGNCAALVGHHLPGCEPAENPLASFGAMAPLSPGKDTMTGHWELAGLVLDKPFHTFPPQLPSFPKDLVRAFQDQTGYSILGNKSASGTDVIEEFGPAHMKGAGLIVYTSADSVFQIAAHEDIVPPDTLYEICRTARVLCDPYPVGRVIARPFTGTPGHFTRTAGRKDFSMSPPGKTILDHLRQHGVTTVGIGKIGDIFCEKGLSVSYHDTGNPACLDRVMSCMETDPAGPTFLFVNLVDTDMVYGHRRDIKGYHDAVTAIDDRLSEITERMQAGDLLIITADHGCDPGFRGTDHTREYVPLLVYPPHAAGMNLNIRQGFFDVAKRLAAFFKIPGRIHGTSFI